MKFRFYYKALLKDMDLCLMQSDTDVERITALGAPSAKMLGNCKFDQAAEGLLADPAVWRERLGLDPRKQTIVIGSTRGEEEELFVLEALSEVGFERVNIIHAPRHLERVEAMSRLITDKTGSVALRSKGETGPYIVLDTYGELSSIYSVADVVIVGGGFMNLGGQNIFQPLAQGKPVLHGVHMQNFRDVAVMAERVGASKACGSPAELAEALNNILNDAELRTTMSRHAKELVESNIGASRRYAQAIADESLKAK